MMRIRKLLVSLVVLSVVGILTNFGHAAEPMGHWRLDEGTGEEIKDSSKGKNNGELLNGPEWVDGVLGKALKFDGQDDCVRIPVDHLPEEYTLSAWIYQISADKSPGDDVDYGQTILSSSSVAGVNYGFWLLSYKGEQIRFYSFANNPGLVNSLLTEDKVISSEKWHHIVVTAVKGDDSVIYVDGVEKARWQNQGEDVSTTAYYIGDLRLDRKITFNGIIDEVAIFDTVLSAADIVRLGSFAISYSGKLATAWGVVKSQIRE
jgi:hypothetical protein